MADLMAASPSPKRKPLKRAPAKAVAGRRSEAAYQLVKLGLTQRAIATTLEVEASTVHRWFSGESKPDAKMRLLIEHRIGVPAPLWDEAHTNVALPTASPSRGSYVEATRTLIDLFADRIDQVRNRMDDCADLTPAEYLEELMKLEKLHRQLRDGLSEREQIAWLSKTRAWGHLKDALANALRPYPDACAAVASLVREVET